MSSALELADSRVSAIEVVDGVATVQFSHAYIHKSRGRPGRDPGTGWSRQAALVLDEAVCSGPLPALPNTVSEGYLEVGGIRHELLPLPFKRKVAAQLALTFVDGARLEVCGHRPVVELLGTPIYLEEFR
ncbi:MAG: hypothetical protein P8124_02850 [Gammaproteobacteria bacterium]|jgi:hypothetical protein